MTKAPALVVTELAPDTANIGGSDAWEFIEIYNNSSRDIDLKDYRLYYYYPDNGNNALWWNTTESKILNPGKPWCSGWTTARTAARPLRI